MHNDYEHYTDKDWVNHHALKRLDRMFDAQLKEETSTMLRFEDYKYLLKIEDDSYGFMTISIKLRLKSQMQDLYRVRFKKKKPKGVIYFFKNAARLNYLYFEESIFDILRYNAENKITK
jgi:hypothetical protein